MSYDDWYEDEDDENRLDRENSERLAHRVEFQMGIDAGEPTEARLSVTGEPYIEFSSFGLFGEKEGLGGWVFSEEKAFELLLRGIVDYWGITRARAASMSSPPMVYWRILPELQSRTITDPLPGRPDNTMTVYNFYARLLVSDKPVLEKAA